MNEKKRKYSDVSIGPEEDPSDKETVVEDEEYEKPGGEEIDESVEEVTVASETKQIDKRIDKPNKLLCKEKIKVKIPRLLKL